MEGSVTPEDILNAEFPEEAMDDLHKAIGSLPHATHALWGLSYWLKDNGDLTGSMMVTEWAQEFAEHEARRLARRPQPARAALSSARSGRPAPSLGLGSCSLEEFATLVRRAADTTRSGRWHGSVFISAVWEQLQREGDPGITYDRFQRRLVQAYQDDLVELSRADLVDVMPPDLVRESETTLGGARFHFVRTDRL